MHKVSIKPQWTIRQPGGDDLAPRLLDLLAQVEEHGSLSGACQRTGASYRHAWDLIRRGEQQLGMPLLLMERGKGSRLTPLGEKLVWAGRRIVARLTPVLDTLASELEVEIERVMSADPSLLRVHASHGFAIEKLLDHLTRQHVAAERRYVGSLEAAASLHDGACDLAGLHVPQGDLEEQAVAHYARWFDLRTTRVIHIATRRQGFMVAPRNPRKIYDVRDLARPDVRFINRQRGSGTRYLLDCLLQRAGVDAARIAGYELGELTHAAVAAYVASGMADVGLGVETPARHFKLDFLPLATESYFFVCQEPSLAKPGIQAVLAILRSEEFQQEVNDLPGYVAHKCGHIETLQQAFPSFRPSRKRGGR